MISFVTLLISFSLFQIVGCGGGGGSDNGTSPRIEDVILYRDVGGAQVESVEFWIGDQTILEVYSHDPDKDVSQLVIDQFHPADDTVPYYPTGTINLPSQSSSDTIFYNITPIDIIGPAGGWRLEFYLIDSKGNESNVWTIYTVTHD